MGFPETFRANFAAMKVRFGPGLRAAAGEEVAALGGTRALVLATPAQEDAAAALAETMGGLAVGVHAKAAMHTPVEVTEAAMERVRALRADCVVSLGGGSTTGLGKAIAYRTDLPQVVIPTTYAGSEATPILGQTEGGVKTTLVSPKVQPETIIYDAELVTTLPADLTVTSALNAMAHAVEALYAPDGNPLSSVIAMEGLRAFCRALPGVRADPGDLTARSETLYGAWLCGIVLGQVGMSLHHKLCHTLGGSFDLPHAQTHAIVLAHATTYNEAAVPDVLAPLAALLGGERAGPAIFDFAASLGAPQALRDLGLQEADLDRAAQLATQKAYPNPRPLDKAAIRALLQDAWEGRRPE